MSKVNLIVKVWIQDLKGNLTKLIYFSSNRQDRLEAFYSRHSNHGNDKGNMFKRKMTLSNEPNSENQSQFIIRNNNSLRSIPSFHNNNRFSSKRKLARREPLMYQSKLHKQNDNLENHQHMMNIKNEEFHYDRTGIQPRPGLLEGISSERLNSKHSFSQNKMYNSASKYNSIKRSG